MNKIKHRYSKLYRSELKIKAKKETENAGFIFKKIKYNLAGLYSVVIKCKRGHESMIRHNYLKVKSKVCSHCNAENNLIKGAETSHFKVKKWNVKTFILQCKTCKKKVFGKRGKERILIRSSCFDCSRAGGPQWLLSAKGKQVSAIVAEKKGRIIGPKTVFVGVKKTPSRNLSIECEAKHIWTVNHFFLLRGGWCKHCARGLYERALRESLNTFTDYKFNFTFARDVLEDLPKRVDRFQFDAFCAELMINVEMDGSQHDKYDPFLHKSYPKFLRQKQNDRLKNKLLRAYGFINIRVKEDILVKALRTGKLKDLVYAIFKKAGLLSKLPADFDLRKLNLSKLYKKDLVYADSMFTLVDKFLNVDAQRFPVDKIRRNRKTEVGAGYKVIHE